jgi:type I restriction enzyme S subunit
LITVDCWPLNTSLYGYKTFNNNLVYLKYFVSYFRIERFSHGAGVPTLDRKLVHKELAPSPPIELQHQFAERINAIEQQKAIAQASLEKSEELFNSLLQKAFKGELV